MPPQNVTGVIISKSDIKSKGFLRPLARKTSAAGWNFLRQGIIKLSADSLLPPKLNFLFYGSETVSILSKPAK